MNSKYSSYKINKLLVLLPPTPQKVSCQFAQRQETSQGLIFVLVQSSLKRLRLNLKNLNIRYGNSLPGCVSVVLLLGPLAYYNAPACPLVCVSTEIIGVDGKQAAKEFTLSFLLNSTTKNFCYYVFKFLGFVQMEVLWLFVQHTCSAP